MDTAWIWFLIGLGLILAEFAVPGVVLVFFGVAAWIVAIFDWIGVDSLTVQLLIFSISSVLLLFVARRYVKSWFRGDEKGGGADLESEFVGKVVTVVAPIAANDYGKVELKGAQWKAFSTAALKAGDLAQVTQRDGLCLHVEPRAEA
ncbi:MAG: NfeD family protein [Verrucomicrobiota bacterium]